MVSAGLAGRCNTINGPLEGGITVLIGRVGRRKELFYCNVVENPPGGGIATLQRVKNNFLVPFWNRTRYSGYYRLASYPLGQPTVLEGD